MDCPILHHGNVIWQRIHENRSKGDTWKDIDPLDHIERARKELDEMEAAILNDCPAHIIREEAGDTGAYIVFATETYIQSLRQSGEMNQEKVPEKHQMPECRECGRKDSRQIACPVCYAGI